MSIWLKVERTLRIMRSEGGPTMKVYHVMVFPKSYGAIVWKSDMMADGMFPRDATIDHASEGNGDYHGFFCVEFDE
jgi:hypothetical protein